MNGICRDSKENLETNGHCENRNCPNSQRNESPSFESSFFADYPELRLSPDATLRAFKTEAYSKYLATTAPLILSEKTMEENLYMPLYFPNMTNSPREPPESEPEFRNFDNAQAKNQVERNVQENSRNSEGAVQQNEFSSQLTNQGLDRIGYELPKSQGNFASHTFSPFGNNVQAQIAFPRLHQPVAAPKPIATQFQHPRPDRFYYGPSTSQGNSASHPFFTFARSMHQPVAFPDHAPTEEIASEYFQVPHPAGTYASETRSGQYVLRQGLQQFQNNSQELPTNQIVTQQAFSGRGSEPLDNQCDITVPTQSSPSLEESDPEASSNHNSILKGFCVMCEEHFGNIFGHWRIRHKDVSGEKNPYYKVTTTQFDETQARLLLPTCTDIEKELKKCVECKKVFFKHRCDNHGCPDPSTNSQSAQPDASDAPPGFSLNAKKGYCLMCKFTFDDLEKHKYQMHKDSRGYAIKNFGQWTLLPEETCYENELVRCRQCLKIMYKFQYTGFRRSISQVDFCRACLQ
ncbi:Hypothetical predicted protein [Cloeon dipterum]|uniref:Uncharacterized protein n=1 Tax=Cloeon dipterum TaxID=197152 RepID=A0A8S1E2E1_9INSE|nr:Hypothetical predicted protein [Cloeon dipterum]